MADGRLGENLSPYHNLMAVKARSADELAAALNAIRMPYRIEWIYFGNGRHYAMISGDHRLNKKRRGRPPKKKENQ
jgi:hypothetical protein